MARAVRVAGMGVSCALGAELPSVRAGLRQASPAARTWSNATFGPSVEFPLYTLNDGDGDVDGRDPRVVIERAARDAVDAAGLSAAERTRLPVFIGTSAFSFDRSAPIGGRPMS